jgi:hypothetical protein
MEMMRYIRYHFLKGFCLLICILLCTIHSDAQPVVKKYSVRDGRMVIELGKQISPKDLEDFIKTFDLTDMDLPGFLKTNNPDSLYKLGWLVEINNKALLVLSKPLFTLDIQGTPSERMIFAQQIPSADLLPMESNVIRYGYNKFRNKNGFLVKDSIVTFYLPHNLNAKQVQLAGTFTNWAEAAFPMKRTDSGWISFVKLAPGKHWYKFIVDGDWQLDNDNLLKENDGRGNINSVYYKTNVNFSFSTNAKKVFLAGSFNNWRQKELLMNRTATGWQLPMYLPNGTHTYKFIADGKWLPDPNNTNKLPDGAGAFNSVLQLGETYTFTLNGYTNAKQVKLAGSFNGWKEDELFMTRTTTGWELPYGIGAGNYEYKFIVDGKWIADPANPLTGNDGNSFIIIHPNYTFRLKAPSAKKVNLAGDFNDWNPGSLSMKREGEYWTFPVYLTPGKHRYKFIVDGEWIIDPANKLWEQNEFDTRNSIIWIAQ